MAKKCEYCKKPLKENDDRACQGHDRWEREAYEAKHDYSLPKIKKY